MTAIIAAILWFGGNIVLSASIPLSGAVFIYFLVVFFSMVSPIRSATDAFFGIRQSMACIQRLNHILLFDTSSDDNKHTTHKPRVVTDIKMEDVCFGYAGDNYVINGLNINFSHGFSYAIVGVSGSGKTTLMDLLFRFYDVSSGAIMINGTNIKDWDTSSLRKSMGYVPQESYLFNNTVMYNLTLGDESIPYDRVVKVTQQLGIHNFIMSLPNGYDTVIGDRGTILSGGQKQRVAIARTVLNGVSVLVLDEATSALDADAENRMLCAVKEIMRNGILIIVSHSKQVVSFADVVYDINKLNRN